jgi:hypothetical protein
LTIRKIGVRIRYVSNRARDEGVFQTIREVTLRSLLWLVWLYIIIDTLTMHLAGFRRLQKATQRIGHLTAEVECISNKVRLGQIKKPKRYYLIAQDKKPMHARLVIVKSI